MRRLRTAFQVLVVAAVAVTGVRHALGWSMTTIEKYCPFGGLETAYALVTRQKFTCAAGELNLALFLALILLTLLARKAFCGWVCPLGAVLEWWGRLGRRWLRFSSFDGWWRPSDRTRKVLQTVLRSVVLAAVLAATWATGELVFRGYDPYYILFSAHGHDVMFWSYFILGGLLALGLAMPMAWCKYLCPLGAALWPASKPGLLRLRRSPDHCTECGACDDACPQSLPVSSVMEVRSGECTLCFECTAACPVAGALELRAPGGKP